MSVIKDHVFPDAIERRPDTLTANEAVALCGTRAVAEIFLARDAVGRTAFIPLDALNSLCVDFQPSLQLQGVSYGWNRVEKHYVGEHGLAARSIWTVSETEPALTIRYEFENPSADERELRVEATAISNVGRLNKFTQHADDLAETEGSVVVFRDAKHPELQVTIALQPDADAVGLADDAATRRNAQAAVLSHRLLVPPGGSGELEIRAAARLSEPANDAQPQTALPSLHDRLADAALLMTPSHTLNQFLRACVFWPAANVRELPLGPPFRVSTQRNETWPVIAAAPEILGVFARDSVQSLWEIGLLGPGMYEPARNTVDTMLGFGPRESVECWTGDGNAWLYSIPMGDTPQCVIGACWLLLWSGDQELGRRWWPAIERWLTVADDCDEDGDALEDRYNGPLVEDDALKDFDHELLYVQCYWCEAFQKAAHVAEWLGRPEARWMRNKADEISRSIENRFATPNGLGISLNSRHELNPRLGHDQIIAAAFNVAGERRSRQIIKALTSHPYWTPDGPASSGGDDRHLVWSVMRWKLIHAMLRLRMTDEAVNLAEGWARQEQTLLCRAPQRLPASRDSIGSGYTVAACRAMRAIVLGLTGLKLDGVGVSFAPQLPSSWSNLSLQNVTIHGKRLTLHVRRGGELGARFNGARHGGRVIPYDALEEQNTVEIAME